MGGGSSARKRMEGEGTWTTASCATEGHQERGQHLAREVEYRGRREEQWHLGCTFEDSKPNSLSSGEGG